MNIDQQIENALNQKMYEWKYKYLQDKNNTIYTTWATESNFKDAYKKTKVISKNS